MAPSGVPNPKPWASPLHAEVPWNDKRWPPCGRTSECFWFVTPLPPFFSDEF